MEKEILLASYWEHHKAAKELALIYPIDNPKRKRIEDEMNVILNKIKQI
jgi:hypothetical protein